MYSSFKVIIVLLCLFLASCRGESGPPSVDLSLSTENISINAATGSTTSREINVSYNGDGLLVGASPDAQVIPNWLTVINTAGSSDSATFNLIVTAPVQEGVYSTTIRFVTGLDGTDVFAYKDIPITVTTIIPIELSIDAQSKQQNLPDTRTVFFTDNLYKPGYASSISYKHPGIDSWLSIIESQDGYNFSVLTTDLEPGDYQATIVFKAESSQDIFVIFNYTVTEPTLSFSEPYDISITNQTELDELTVLLNVEHGMDLFEWLVADSSSMVTATKSMDLNKLEIYVHGSNVNQYANGVYEQWVDIDFRPMNSSQYQTIRINFNLNIDLSRIDSIIPAVAYSGNETIIRVWGENLGHITDEQLLLTNNNFSAVSRINDNEVEFTILPTAEEGEYEVSIDSALEFEDQKAKLVIKPAPSFPIVDLTLPSRAYNVTYDAVRESFYYSAGYSGSAVYRINHNDTNWSWESYSINNPAGLTLTNDGEKLIVGNYNCEVYEVELDIDVISTPSLREGCNHDDYNFIGQFYNGLTIVADTNQWPSLYSYPDWVKVPFEMPMVHSPVGIMSPHKTHMIWTGDSTFNQIAYIYDARSNTVNTWGTVTEINYNVNASLSISAKGERIAHYNDIYNEQLAYIGSLDDLNAVSTYRVGISPDGTRAAMFKGFNKIISVFDISADVAPFPKLGNDISLVEEGIFVDRIVFSEDNSVLFVFTFNTTTNINKMKVYQL